MVLAKGAWRRNVLVPVGEVLVVLAKGAWGRNVLVTVEEVLAKDVWRRNVLVVEKLLVVWFPHPQPTDQGQ